MRASIIQHDLDFGPLAERTKTDMIVVHHTAGENDTIESIHALHRYTNGWAGIGYHYVVHPDGTVHAGRPEWATGAHCQGYNYRSIGVNLVGNFEYQQPTEAQVESLTLLLADLMEQYQIPPEQVTGHRVWNQTACPGANLDAILPDIVAKAVMA